ncbi:Gp19/Gp15/Gp42 family protein [Nonomuraea aridisoli]|uniref:Phage gp6-like head-tail connector protein n=1 Tax=Nonomuraea aridisoli TaxID=2070368 RepID=A0A2W2E908_9ACTN|nr:Gp19/Gp15/Gp42 family protein [Nonomuraea aridisoli]PZG20602.1 hypothetical protein C1J01_08855 [Nonomuraea aridisoli]
MAYATVQDVRARMGRPLTSEEETLAETLLGDAEVLIEERISDLAARAADPQYLKRLVIVEANAVLRVLRNPEGYRSESDGDYSYSRSAEVASGLLEITDADWKRLGVRIAGAFTIAPAIGTPRWGPLAPRRRRGLW